MKKSIMIIVVFSVMIEAAFAQGQRVPLSTAIPEPLFEGTPEPIKSNNLDKAGVKKRPPLMVPKGVKNVALGKEVTSSVKYPGLGDFDLITDGDKEGINGSFVELGAMKQYVQIDFGKTYEIHAIVVWHYHKMARAYKDVVVQLADDEDFIKNVRTVFNNDHDNSSGLGVGKDKEWIETNYGRPISVKAEKAQYVRLYSNGSTSDEMNHYVEVEVFGK